MKTTLYIVILSFVFTISVFAQDFHFTTLEGHTDKINSVAFSPDGTTLASGSNDRTIRLWNATTGFHQQTLTGHTSSIYDISFIQDGQTLASKSNDGTIRLWDASTGQEKETLSVASGVYFYVLITGEYFATRKMLILK